ncbi:hypothetical protein [Polyangium mundeleinium]|uniref:Uncharacterized protein n=1 Tax=Polyangium mundeleinium TaxID=2995306 RepID=A0ABT5EGB7_9BACT|nr:hypothetical protein [Polyangium mundeleinium]MDC0739932.1 hypothetical protein [Polyangium mundeleinium]
MTARDKAGLLRDMSSLESYFPTLDTARARLPLPAGEPVSVERLAMLVVHAALIRRTSWAEDVESAPAGLESGEPPPPDDLEVHHHVRIDASLGGGECTACTANPGQRRCRICGGAGTLFNGKTRCSCDEGFIPCPTCGGTAEASRVRLRYYTDTPAFLSEAYMPTHITAVPALFGLESRMEQDVQFQQALPEELRCHDLTGRVTGSAYRGGEKIVRPDFHGHDFGDAIDKALAGLTAIGAGASVVRHVVRAYAWPFLRLQWGTGLDVAIYVDRIGSLKVFAGAGGLPSRD